MSHLKQSSSEDHYRKYREENADLTAKRQTEAEAYYVEVMAKLKAEEALEQQTYGWSDLKNDLKAFIKDMVTGFKNIFQKDATSKADPMDMTHQISVSSDSKEVQSVQTDGTSHRKLSAASKTVTLESDSRSINDRSEDSSHTFSR